MTRVVWHEKVKNNVPKYINYDMQNTTLCTHIPHHAHIHTTLPTHIPDHAHITDIPNYIDTNSSTHTVNIIS